MTLWARPTRPRCMLWRCTRRGGSGTSPAVAAQRAAEANTREEEEGGEVTRLRNVVGDATATLPANNVTTREYVDKVATAVRRNTAGGGHRGEGVVEAGKAATVMNQDKMMQCLE
jgi:hypothetical protein